MVSTAEESFLDLAQASCPQLSLSREQLLQSVHPPQAWCMVSAYFSVLDPQSHSLYRSISVSVCSPSQPTLWLICDSVPAGMCSKCNITNARDVPADVPP